MARSTLIAALGFALVALACTPDFEEAQNVKDLRVLAVRAEPPEVLFDTAPVDIPPVTIEALLADPRDPTREIVWEAWACSPEASYCEEAAYAERLTSGRGGLDSLRFDFTPSEALFAAALANDLFAGFGGLPIMLELRIWDGEGGLLRAVKRVGYTFPLPHSPLPPEKVANTNPLFAEIEVNGAAVVPGQTLEVEAEQEITILPQANGGTPCADEPLSADCYWVTSANLPEGGGLPTGIEFLQVPEFYTYSFYTSAGKLSHAQTGGAPSPFFDNKKVEDVSVKWTAPVDADEATIWIVVDDGRGGASWRRIQINVTGGGQPAS